MLLSPTAWGQSFLEKLEAKVRERMESAQPDPANADNGSATSEQESTQGAAEQRSEQVEELPAPARRGLPSILEPGRNPGAPPPTASPSVLPPRATPPASLELSEPSVVPLGPAGTEPRGRVYLGLEAEETPGGGIGVRVSGVSERSPAWKAGVRVGDRIVALNGFAIGGLNDMVTQLSKTRSGQTVRMLISRGGRNVELVAVLMDAALSGQIAAQADPAPLQAGPAWLGLIVNDLTEAFREQFGIRPFRGVAVTDVQRNSPAYKAGIRPGDAIVEASGLPIENARDLIGWLSTTVPGQRVELLVYRGGQSQVVEVILEIDPSGVASSPRGPSPSTVLRAQSPANPPVENRPGNRAADRTGAAPESRVPVPAPLGMAADQLLPNTSLPNTSLPSNGPTNNGPTNNGPTNNGLSAENQRLRAELADTQRRLLETEQRLADTEARLEQILQQLKAIGN